MKIIDYFKCDNKELWKNKIVQCDWRAAVFLAELLEKETFHDVLGEGTLFILNDSGNIASFATLTRKDCIDDNSIFPWIGFVFTVPEYRGRRCAGEVIAHACKSAYEQGYDNVYLATDHIGLYEKYGFTFLEERTDIYGEKSRIYRRNLNMSEAERNIKNFLDSCSRLTAYPSKRKMKLYAMLYLSEKFERGRVYTEKEVNVLLNEWHTFGDPATLRRELYNHRILNRSADGSKYALEAVLPAIEEMERRYG